MIKFSDLPDGTIVEVNNLLVKKEGDNWVALDGTNATTYDSVDLDTLNTAFNIPIIGIPYPVALKLAEWADPFTNPEELILDAAKEI